MTSKMFSISQKGGWIDTGGWGVIFAETEPAWSDFGFIGNLDMGIVFTFLTSVVVKSTITLTIIVTDFDLLNNSFGIQQG